MTSPRIYQDPVGTKEVQDAQQDQRGEPPEGTREGLVDVEGDEAKGKQAIDDTAEDPPTTEDDRADEVSDTGGDSDPDAGAPI